MTKKIKNNGSDTTKSNTTCKIIALATLVCIAIWAFGFKKIDSSEIAQGKIAVAHLQQCAQKHNVEYIVDYIDFQADDNNTLLSLSSYEKEIGLEDSEELLKKGYFSAANEAFGMLLDAKTVQEAAEAKFIVRSFMQMADKDFDFYFGDAVNKVQNRILLNMISKARASIANTENAENKDFLKSLELLNAIKRFYPTLFDKNATDHPSIGEAVLNFETFCGSKKHTSINFNLDGEKAWAKAWWKYANKVKNIYPVASEIAYIRELLDKYELKEIGLSEEDLDNLLLESLVIATKKNPELISLYSLSNNLKTYNRFLDQTDM